MSIDDVQRVVEVLDMNPRAVEEGLDPTYRPVIRFGVRDIGHLARLAALYERGVEHLIVDGVHRRAVTLRLDALDVEFFVDEPVSPVGPVLDFLAGLAS